MSERWKGSQALHRGSFHLLMRSEDAGELIIVIFALGIFLGYHTWLYWLQSIFPGRRRRKWFNVYESAGLSRLLWTHSILADDSEAITGVQTLRNAIMVCAMMATASAYVGGRALPSILFDPEWRSTLDGVAAVDPLTGGEGRKPLISSVVKACICLGLVFSSFICFAQSARYWVHLGFAFKLPAKPNTSGYHPEGEALAITHQAGLCFSLGLRLFYAFGLAALYIPGPTSLLASTLLMVIILFLTDNVHCYEYEKLLLKIRRRKPSPY